MFYRFHCLFIFSNTRLLQDTILDTSTHLSTEEACTAWSRNLEQVFLTHCNLNLTPPLTLPLLWWVNTVLVFYITIHCRQGCSETKYKNRNFLLMVQLHAADIDMKYAVIGMLIAGNRCKSRCKNGECPKWFKLCSFLAWTRDVVSFLLKICQEKETSSQ